MIGQADKIGDEILFTLPAVSGAISIDDFNDTVIGETVNRYFEKTFQIATDNIWFTDSKILTQAELQAIVVDSKNSYIIKVIYRRAGSDTTGTLILDSLSIVQTNAAVDNGFEYNSSNFVKFFNTNDSEVMDWSLNVLRKMFFHGSLAEYIIRGKALEEITGREFDDSYEFSFD
jgi:hypothetical protein